MQTVAEAYRKNNQMETTVFVNTSLVLLEKIGMNFTIYIHQLDATLFKKLYSFLKHI
jgi:hypothetical protein